MHNIIILDMRAYLWGHKTTLYTQNYEFWIIVDVELSRCALLPCNLVAGFATLVQIIITHGNRLDRLFNEFVESDSLALLWGVESKDSKSLVWKVQGVPVLNRVTSVTCYCLMGAKLF